MDLLKLQCKLKTNPTIYKKEFDEQLNLYKSLIKMELKPIKETNNILNFLTFSIKYYKNEYFPKLLIEHFEIEIEPKIKKEIFQCIFRLKMQDLITEYDFFRIVLENKQKIPLNRLRLELKKKQIINNRIKLFKLLKDYLINGDIFQRPISAYLILFLYEQSKDKIPEIKSTIIECLYKDSKISKMIILYFLNILDFNDEIEIKFKRMEDKKNEEKQKEINLLSKVVTLEDGKSKIFYDLKKEEAKLLAKNLFEFLKNSKEERVIRILRLKIIGILKVHFNLKIKIYDFVLNLIDTKNDDLKIVMSILIDSLNEKEVNKCVKKILNTFCLEFKDDDWIVYGINLLTEICIKYEFIRNDIKDHINIFKKSKKKSIFYAYNQCMRAIKYGLINKKEIDFIKRKRIKGVKEENY